MAHPDDSVSRHDAARMLGVSLTTITRLDAQGKLTPVFVDGRKVYYARKDVEKLAANYQAPSAPEPASVESAFTPALCLRAFEMFRQKASLEDLVRELLLTPEQIEALYQRWKTPIGGADSAKSDAKAAAKSAKEKAEEEARAQREYDRSMSEWQRQQDEERKAEAARDAARKKRMAELQDETNRTYDAMHRRHVERSNARLGVEKKPSA